MEIKPTKLKEVESVENNMPRTCRGFVNESSPQILCVDEIDLGIFGPIS